MTAQPSTTAQPATTAHQSSGATRYRPELDGLRAVAALLVIAFHAGMSSMVGGYIGVDVFFVLSGFLITGLLVASPSRGPRALLNFYARRMRRLLPAALVVLVVTAAIWTAVAGSVERDPIVGDVRSAALYFANWHFTAQATDYFAQTDAPSPVIHFWSLATEEQFYLLWPAIVMVITAVAAGKRGRRWLAATAVVLGAASLVSLTIATREGSERSYFGTDCRAYQLLAGALLALWAYDRRPGTHTRRLVLPHITQLLAFGALLVIATSAVDLGPSTRGVAAVGCAVVLLWSLQLAPTGIAGRVLSRPTATNLGRISYGTYLWHWPVILLIRRFVVISPHYLFVAATVISVGLAAVSYRVLEQPIRHTPRLSRYATAVCSTGLAVSVVVGLVVAPRLLTSDRHPIVVPIAMTHATGDPSQPLSGSSDPIPGQTTDTSGSDAATTPDGVSTPAPAHTPVPSAATLRATGKGHPGRTCLTWVVKNLGCLAHNGDGPTVLVVGDSHEETLLPVFQDLAVKYDLTLYTWMYYVCPWQRAAEPQTTNAAPCRKDKTTLYQTLLPEIRPDVVITVNRGYDDPNDPRTMINDDRPDGPNDPGTVLAATTPDAVSAILRDAKELVQIEPWPSLPFSQRACLATVTYDDQCEGRAAGKLASESAIEQIAAHNPRVKTISLDDAVCPRLPICDPVVNGTVTRIDTDHLTIPFAKTLEPVLDARLAGVGVFD